jgi:hypothetical protein
VLKVLSSALKTAWHGISKGSTTGYTTCYGDSQSDGAMRGPPLKADHGDTPERPSISRVRGRLIAPEPQGGCQTVSARLFNFAERHTDHTAKSIFNETAHIMAEACHLNLIGLAAP